MCSQRLKRFNHSLCTEGNINLNGGNKEKNEWKKQGAGDQLLLLSISKEISNLQKNSENTVNTPLSPKFTNCQNRTCLLSFFSPNTNTHTQTFTLAEPLESNL